MPRRRTKQIITSFNEQFTLKEPSLQVFMKLQDKLQGDVISPDGLLDLLEACVVSGPEDVTRDYLADLDAITQAELLAALQDMIDLEKMELLQKKLAGLNK